MKGVSGYFFLISGVFFFHFAGASSTLTEQEPAKVTVQTLQRADEFDILLFPARAYSRVQTSLYAEGEGVVRSLPVNVGQKISKQDTLMVIQNTDPVYQYAPVQVKSSVSGVVSSLEVKQGTHVTKGLLLATVMDPSRLRISIEVPAQDLLMVQTGKYGEFKGAGLSHPIKVKILGVSPLVDPKTGTATADLELAEKATIPAGAVGQVTLNTNSHRAMVLAEDALVYREGKPVLRVLVDGKVKLVGVELGVSHRGNVEVMSGVKDGETVVLRASRFVSEGEKVIIESEKKVLPGKSSI